MMHFRFSFAILGATLGTLSADDGGYAPIPAKRYEAMEQRSPFALATVVAPPQAPQASFAANWYVVGVGRLGETDFVTIKSRDAGTLFSLYGNEPHPATGATLVSVNWSDTVGKSTVVLRKGTEMAKLEFNEEELRTAPAVAANPGNPNNPGAAGTVTKSPSNGASMAGSNRPPGAPLPPPTGLPRGPVVVTPVQQGTQVISPQATGAPGAAGEFRRRVRPIPVPNSPPSPAN